jgi:predicted outer membrane repeat protein
MACDSGSPHLSDTSFLANDALYYGGGMTAHNSAAELVRCSFQDNSAGSGGGALLTECWPANVARGDGPAPVMEDCVLVGNTSSNGGGVYARFGAVPTISGCTLYANSASYDGAGIFCWQTSATVTECIIANSTEGAAISCSDPSAVPYVRRCVIFANEGGDTPCGDAADILFQDPLFCDAAGGNLGVCADSPCLPGVNPWGVLIGAHGQSCGPCSTAVQSTTWGAIKTMFR